MLYFKETENLKVDLEGILPFTHVMFSVLTEDKILESN